MNLIINKNHVPESVGNVQELIIKTGKKNFINASRKKD